MQDQNIQTIGSFQNNEIINLSKPERITIDENDFDENQRDIEMNSRHDLESDFRNRRARFLNDLKEARVSSGDPQLIQ